MTPGLVVRSSAGRWVIAACVLGSAMAAIDATVVGIALPAIGRQFHASLGLLQWVVTAYTLTLGALLLLGGVLGDRFGRRRTFSVGVAWFAVASVLCALSPDPALLIAARALQGVGAALLVPGSLAILQAAFAHGERGRAIGAWSGLGGVATAAGPLLGGYLLVVASWRWIFVINVPLAVLVLVVAARHVPESRDPAATGPLDLAGAALAVVALAGATIACIEGPTLGWSSPLVVAGLAAGALGALGFVLVESRRPTAMLPLSLFRRRTFSVTNAVTLVVYAALGGVLFLLPVQLQVADGDNALEAGLALLPITVLMLALSSRSGRLASRLGPRLQMSVGPVVVGLGLVLLGAAASGSGYVDGVLPGVTVLGLGLATTVAPLSATALAALPDGRAGLASAVNNDVARIGSLLAVAVLPALVGLTGHAYLEPATLSAGFVKAVRVAGAACAAAGLVAAVGLRAPRRPAPPVGASCFHCALDGAPLSGGGAQPPASSTSSSSSG